MRTKEAKLQNLCKVSSGIVPALKISQKLGLAIINSIYVGCLLLAQENLIASSNVTSDA